MLPLSSGGDLLVRKLRCPGTLGGMLGAEFGRGFDPSNLRYMRMFFQRFPNRDAARHKSKATGESEGLRSELSWTHYRSLLSIESPAAREWYMHEAADQQWSTRALDRQITP